jgi:uncharacterized protein (TIGR02266 family)
MSHEATHGDRPGDRPGDPGDRALAELEPRLAAIGEDGLLRPSTDPHAAAATALLVADYLGQEELASKLAAVSMSPEAVHELGSLSRALIAVVNQLGGEYLPDAASIPGELVSRGEALRAAVSAALEKTLADDPAVRPWLDAIKLGTGVVDLVYDLRTLGELCHENSHAGAAASAVTVHSAVAAADAIEFALRTDDTSENKKARNTVVRLWTLFVPAYERAAAAGRVLTREQGHAQQFPPLAQVASHRRARRRPIAVLSAQPSLRRKPPPSHRPSGGPGAGTRAASSVKGIPVSPALPDFDEVELFEGETLEPIAVPGVEHAHPHARPPSVPPPRPPSVPPRPPSVPPAGDATHASGDRESWSDTRRGNRHSVEIEVNVASHSNLYLGFTENLSSGGVFVATYVAKPIGSHIEVNLTFPGGDALKVHGVVRWLRDATPDDWPGMGVQFENLSPDDEAKIRKFLALRDPLFYDD